MILSRNPLTVVFRRVLGRFVLFLLLGFALDAPTRAQTVLFADSNLDQIRSAPWPAGAPVGVRIPAGSGGLDLPIDIAIGPDRMLYVVGGGNFDSVGRYFPEDGRLDTSFVLPAGGNLTSPSGLAFHPTTGELYVTDFDTHRIVVYDLDRGIVARQYTSGLTTPTMLTFDGAGTLFVCEWDTDSVKRLAPNGTVFTSFIPSGAGTLDGPEKILVRGGQVFVVSALNGKVLRYAWSNGTFFGTAAPRGTETLGIVVGLAFLPGGDMLVSSPGNGAIYRYPSDTQSPVSTFCTSPAPLGLCYSDPNITARFPLVHGELVATSGPVSIPWGNPDPTSPVVKVVDARTGGPSGTNWFAPIFTNRVDDPLGPNAWTFHNLGPVFAACIDDSPQQNIFVAATQVYGQMPFGPSGPGAVYKLSGCDGSILKWVVTGPAAVGQNRIPNTGAALGDICHDRIHQQFFVSNFEDGKIYRFRDVGGTAQLIDTFDPFGPHLDVNTGRPVRGDRIWALHRTGPDDSYPDDWLLFSVWLRDDWAKKVPWPSWLPPLPVGSPENNAIFRALVDAQGAIIPTSIQLVHVMSPLDLKTYSNPVSDIAGDSRFFFSAERTMTGSEFWPDAPGVWPAHRSRVMRVPLLPQFYKVGDAGDGNNSAGGVCAGRVGFNRWVWGTGDALQYPGSPAGNLDYVYGLQRFSQMESNSSDTPWSKRTKLVDLDWNVTSHDKTMPGDVEIVRRNSLMTNCPSGGGGGGIGN